MLLSDDSSGGFVERKSSDYGYSKFSGNGTQ